MRDRVLPGQTTDGAVRRAAPEGVILWENPSWRKAGATASPGSSGISMWVSVAGDQWKKTENEDTKGAKGQAMWSSVTGESWAEVPYWYWWHWWVTSWHRLNDKEQFVGFLFQPSLIFQSITSSKGSDIPVFRFPCVWRSKQLHVQSPPAFL